MPDVEFPVLDKELAQKVLPDLHRLTEDQAWMLWTDENYLYDLPEKWTLSRLARRADGEILGYALCSRKDQVLWLHRLVVGAAYRGQGLGESILQELERIAEAMNLQEISLKTPDDNEDTIRFYHRHGFRAGQSANGYLPMTRMRTLVQKVVGIHQPNFLPWPGYFYKIHRSDAFVILDDVAAPSRGYHNRTGVLVQGRQHWLSVPISKRDPAINRIEQADDRWVEKYLKTLQAVYKKTDF